jgi:hypothetical protein
MLWKMTDNTFLLLKTLKLLKLLKIRQLEIRGEHSLKLQNVANQMFKKVGKNFCKSQLKCIYGKTHHQKSPKTTHFIKKCWVFNFWWSLLTMCNLILSPLPLKFRWKCKSKNFSEKPFPLLFPSVIRRLSIFGEKNT